MKHTCKQRGPRRGGPNDSYEMSNGSRIRDTVPDLEFASEGRRATRPAWGHLDKDPYFVVQHFLVADKLGSTLMGPLQK